VWTSNYNTNTYASGIKFKKVGSVTFKNSSTRIFFSMFVMILVI